MPAHSSHSLPGLRAAAPAAPSDIVFGRAAPVMTPPVTDPFVLPELERALHEGGLRVEADCLARRMATPAPGFEDYRALEEAHRRAEAAARKAIG